MSKGAAIISIIFSCVVGLLLGSIFAGGNSSEDGEEIGNVAPAEEAGDVERFKIPVTKDQPQKGSNEALVTIVEWSDFECPFCARVTPTIKQIKDTYGDKVRFVWRNNPLPFHQNAGPAATVAMEAHSQKGDEGFWKAHDKLFEMTASKTPLTRPNLEKAAGELGLDVGKVKTALDQKKYQASITADQELAKKFQANGTPHFFINGRRLSGAQPFPKFKEIIDDEIGRAEKAIARGVKKNQIYAALTANANEGGAAPAAADPAAQKRPDPNAVYKMQLTGKEPMKGGKDALVTIVEFSDFECPFCARVEPTIKQVMDTYGKDVRVVWMNNPLPFHPAAMPAAIASHEAYLQKGDKGFWKMHEELFKATGGYSACAQEQRAAQQAQKPFTKNCQELKLSNATIEKAAKAAGINVAKVKAAIAGNTHKAVIEQQQAAGRKLGAGGTPAFFINGRFLSGAQPFPAFKNLIDQEMAKAKKLVESGTPRSQVYTKTIANGAVTQQFIGGGAAPGAAAAKPAPEKYEIPVPSDAPFIGGKNAKVVIQEFSDFECPFCSRVLPAVEEIKKTYGNKVKIVWRDYPLPFHQNAPLAHQAAREAFEQGGSAKFFAYHDKLFANQKALTRPNLEKWAQELGLNMAKFKQALDSGKHKAKVGEGAAAISKAGITRFGTPSFFINGKLVSGAQPFAAFKTEIDAALK